MSPAPTIQEEVDLFQNITTGKIPENVKNILKQNGKDVSAMEKQFQSAIQQGGQTKNDAIVGYYTLFDQIGQTNKYQNLLDNYQRAAQQPKQNTQQDAVQTTDLSTAPIAQNPSSIKDDVGNMGLLERAAKGVANSGLELAKGISQILTAGQVLTSKDEDSVSGQEQEILPTDSYSIRAKKQRSNYEIQADRTFKERARAVSKFWDDFKFEVPNESPVSLDKETNDLNFDNISNTRAWVGLISDSIGSTLNSTLIAAGAARLSKGKSAATVNALKNAAKGITFVTSTAQMLPGYLEEGLNNGLTYSEAMGLAGPLAVVNGTIEVASLQFVMGKYKWGKDKAQTVVREVLNQSAKSAIRQLARKEITKEAFLETIKQTSKSAFKSIGNETMIKQLGTYAGRKVRHALENGSVPEMLEEAAQGAMEYGAKSIFNEYNATKGSTSGDGQFELNKKQALVDGILGMAVAGIVGGAGAAATMDSKIANQSLFTYANTDIRNQIVNGAQALDDVKSQGKIFNRIEKWRQDGQFNYKNSAGQNVFDQAAYDQVMKNSNMMYDTAWEFKDYNGFNDFDRYNMFKIASTRDALQQEGQSIQQIKDQIQQYDEMIADPSKIVPDQSGYTPSLTMIESERANIAKQLGQFNPDTNTYEIEDKFTDRATGLENIIKQAIPAINNPQTKVLAERFMANGFNVIDSLSNPSSDTFIPTREVTLNDGTVVVANSPNIDEDTEIRQLIVEPSITSTSVLDQIGNNSYKPVDRFSYRTAPVSDFNQYLEISQSNGGKIARDTTKPYSVSVDANDVMSFAQSEVEALQQDPAQIDNITKNVNDAYKLYNKISEHEDASDEGVVKMAKEEFFDAIGFQPIQEPTSDPALEGQPETEVSTESTPIVDSQVEPEVVDPKEAVILSDVIGGPITYQGRPGTIEKIGDTFLIETDRGLFELPNTALDDSPISNFEITKRTEKKLKQPKTYKVSFSDDSNVNVNGVDYTINNSPSGSIESLSPSTNPDQNIKNEKILVAVEVERSRLNFNTISSNEETVNEMYNNAIDQSNVEGNIADNIFSKNFTQQTESALSKMENGEDLTEADKLALDLWVTDAIIENDKQRVKTPESEIFKNLADYFELVNKTLYQYEQSEEIQSQRKSDIQDGVSNGNTTKAGGVKSGSESNQKVNETTNGQGSTDSTEEPYSVESEYAQSREQRIAIENLEARPDDIQSISGLPNQDANQVQETEPEQDDITGLIESVQRVAGEIEQRNRSTEEAISEIFPESDEQPIDSGSSQEGAPESEGTVTEVKAKKKGVPKNKRKIKDPERLQALAKFPSNITEEVYQYLVGNGQVNTADVNKLFNGTGNTERQAMISSTANYGPTIDELAHQLWEDSNFPGVYETSDYKDAIETTILSYPGLKELTDRLNGQQEQQVDPDFVPDESGAPVVNTFEENIARSNEDPDFVPFSDNEPQAFDPALTQQVLGQLSKSFPNIDVLIAPTQEEYVSRLNEIPTARTVFTKDNVPYGYVNPFDGSINLDPAQLNTNTAIHEYGHIWSAWAKENNPDLYKKGISLVENSSYFKKAKANPLYSNLSQDQLLEEALATAIGDKGESFVTTAKKNTFKDWLRGLFDKVKEYLGIRSKSADQILDSPLSEFTSDVVTDLMSGNPVSQISSAEIASILSTAKVQPVETEIVENPEDPELLFHYKTPIVPGTIAGEKAGSSQDFKDEAIRLLGPIYAQLTAYTDAQKKTIQQVFEQTGWELTGHNTWNADISSPKKENFFFVEDKVTLIPSQPKSSSNRGRVAQTYMNGVDKLLNNNSFGVRTAQRLFSFMKNLNLLTPNQLNIESVVEMIDDEDGLFTQLITKEKRAGETRMNQAINIMMEPYLNYQKAMAKFTTRDGSSNLTTVGKVEVNAIFNDKKNGKLIQKKIWMPTGHAMNIARTEKTQRSMGIKYLTTGSVASGTSETHSSLVLDDKHFAGDRLISNNNSILFSSDNKQYGATFISREIQEVDPNGKLVPYKNSDSEEVDVVELIFSNREVNRLINRFERGTGAETGEVEAFKAGDKFFNIPGVVDLLAKENDDFLNPDTPFQRVPYYSPLATKVDISADMKMNSFSPNLEDSKRLHERKHRPEMLFLQDDMQMAKYYMDGVSMVLGSGRLVHNIKNITNALSKENSGSAYTTDTVSYLNNYSKDLQNFQQKKADAIGREAILRFLNTVINKNTAFIFRGNIGIALTQPSAYINALGQGIIDDTYLLKSVGKGIGRGGRGLWDSFFFAGTTINRTTGEGDTNALGMETGEKKMLDYLFGESITDPIYKAEFDKAFATLKGRALYGNSQYIEGITFDSALTEPSNLPGNLLQAKNKLEGFLEEYTMAPMRRLDRAVIFTFVDAAKLQATNEGLSGLDFDKRVAELATNLMYATNQMNSLADTTGLQRDTSAVNKLITIYTGQTQKLFNQLHQSIVGYMKYGQDSSTPEVVKKQYRNRLIAASISNLILVPAYVSASRLAWGAIKTLIKGGDLEEPEDAFTDFLFDFTRGFTGIVPGGLEQIFSTVISYLDNKPWEQGLLEVPGLDMVESAFKSMTSFIKSEGKSEDQMNKIMNNLVRDSSKILSMYMGVPKTWSDIGYSWLTGDTGAKKKPNRPVKSFSVEGDFSDDDFEDDFED